MSVTGQTHFRQYYESEHPLLARQRVGAHASAMIRTSLTVLCAMNLFGACLPPDSGTSTEGAGEPVVGKLKFNDRVVNLTPDVFADEKSGVPRNATAEIIADIDPRTQRTERSENGPDRANVQRIGSD